ncbi:MAG: PTS system galactitol-specific IIB component [Erysipelotrichaceae bacterium]|nr:MAG: PTS system galactitol-specific IIB component [Erysipelotrichaceae bacterium]
MKTIIVACGAGVATSSILTQKISNLLEKNRIDYKIIQCSLNEISTYVDNADLVVSSMKIYKELKIPKILGIAFLTGIDEEEISKQILEVLEH